MNKQKLIKIFYFISFNFLLLYAKLPETLFGIKLRSLEDEYVRLLFDQSLDLSSRQMLSIRLSAVQLCIDIDRALNDSRITKLANLEKKNKKKNVKLDLRTEFDQLSSNISQNQILSPVDVCRLWEFQLLLNDVNQALNQNGIFIKKVKAVNKIYDCNELKNIEGILPIWATDFKKNITLKHFTFISSKLSSDFINMDFPRWFSTERFANECELLYRFRIISAGGDFEQTKRVKSVLTKFLLSNQEVSLLDMFYPLEIAADVLFEESFVTLLLGLFDVIPEQKKLKQIFEMVDEHQKIMTSKIWDIFEVLVNINPNVYDENETYKTNLYMECPNDQVVYHLDKIDQNEMAEDVGAYTLMQSYYYLMGKVGNSQQTKQIKKLLQKLEMDAAVWVYKDLIQQELFEFATFLDVRTDEFDAIIEQYTFEWYEVSTTGGQSVYNALCSIHQFAQTIVENTILMQNVGWNLHVKSLLETPTSFYDTKLILLPTEKDNDLAKIDCSDGKLASKFMKEKFSWIVPNVVFETVEATFPEIMKYDSLLDSQYISLLVYRLLFKSGTNFAKFYEARIANHFIEKDINDAFEDQRQLLNVFHFGYLARLMQDNEFLKLWDQSVMTTDVFNDNKILYAHYNCFLFGELSCASTSKMGTLLLAELILFVRWVENRIGTARHTIANKRMANNWEKDKKQLENIYDQIYDEEDSAIMLIRFHFSECMLDAKLYMEQYKKWMGSQHKDVIFKLIKEDEAFVVRLKSVYESEKALFKQDLSNLVDTAENSNLNEIFCMDASENCHPDFVGVKLSSFEDNNFLAKHFEKLVETMQNDSVDPSINSNVQLLHFGIYANEIFHRIELK
uniref:Uncharacterized protein n=1 Tax=Globodera rostochiensis TaxID=31243 RepID=A0A914IEF4_GLORO